MRTLQPIDEEPFPHVLLEELEQTRLAVRQIHRPGVPFWGSSGHVKDAGDPRPNRIIVVDMADGLHEGDGDFGVIFEPVLEELGGPYLLAVPVLGNQIKVEGQEK
jgi:hypothetical protein